MSAAAIWDLVVAVIALQRGDLVKRMSFGLSFLRSDMIRSGFARPIAASRGLKNTSTVSLFDLARSDTVDFWPKARYCWFAHVFSTFLC